MNKQVLLLALVAGLFGMSVFAQAGGNAEAGKAKAAVCAGCHGPGGNSAIPMYPKLAGMSGGYIAKQLKDFQKGNRIEPQMVGMVAGLSKQDMQDLGAYFAAQKTQISASITKKQAKRGERIYRGGIADTGVPACMSCHGPSGHGIPTRFPRVSGQHAAYAKKQLLAFKEGDRKNDGEIMTRIAFRMSKQQIEDVAAYMASLH